jgi:GNAT superfamily N-acetyltransferase
MKPIFLRRAGVEDSAIIQEILDGAPRYTMNTEGVSRDPEGGISTLQALPPGCRYDQKYVWILEQDGDAIGVVDVIRDFPQPGTALLGLLLIQEAFQSQGLGRKAYQTVEDQIRAELGCSLIRLAIVDSNPVQAFWEKMGFHLTGETRPHEGAKIQSTKRVMEKSLFA